MMKLLITMAAIFSCLSLSAQEYASIKGIAKKDNLETVKLYRVEYGTTQEIASSVVTQDGNYGFMFVPQNEGFYIVGDDKDNRYRVYIKKGDNVEFNIMQYSVEMTKNNSVENLKLYEWETIFAPIKSKALNFQHIFFYYGEFFPVLAQMVPKAEAFKKTIKTKNPRFDDLMKSTVDYDMDYYAMAFLDTPKINKADMKPFVRLDVKEYPAYYQTVISDKLFSDNNILKMDFGAAFIDVYTSFYNKMNGLENKLDAKVAVLKDDALIAEQLLFTAKRITKYQSLLDLQEKYAKYFTELHHKNRLGLIASQLFKGEDGGAAADFIYPDVNGKMVALSDFKGKYILVDVWATWCGPCNAEIPSLIKLEEEFQGKDIVFMGVSVDENKDHEKWKKMIEEKGLKGVQLFAGGWSKITKDYQIKGIPRFMLFDRDGKIIKLSAPRPSNPELRELIVELLKK